MYQPIFFFLEQTVHLLGLISDDFTESVNNRNRSTIEFNLLKPTESEFSCFKYQSL